MLSRKYLLLSATRRRLLVQQNGSGIRSLSAMSSYNGLSRSNKAYSLERRLYSDKKESSSEESKDAIKEEPVAENSKSNEQETKEIDPRDKEIATLKDQILRSIADSRNSADRANREMDNARKFAIQKFAKDLIDSIDIFDRALKTVPKDLIEEKAEENKDLVNLYNGLKMTEDILLKTFKRHGIERTDPAGKQFDPNTMEATFEVVMPGKEPGSVFHVDQHGYLLNGRLIRPAKVGVAKGDEESK